MEYEVSTIQNKFPYPFNVFVIGRVDFGGETNQRGAPLPDPLEGLHRGKRHLGAGRHVGLRRPDQGVQSEKQKEKKRPQTEEGGR